MVNILRKIFAHPVLAIGSTVLWGIIELIALSRAGRSNGGSGA